MKFVKIKHLANRLMAQLELFSMRYKTRRQLVNLDAYLLGDVGLAQQQALKEGHRYFWQGDNKRDDVTSNLKPVKTKVHHHQK